MRLFFIVYWIGFTFSFCFGIVTRSFDPQFSVNQVSVPSCNHLHPDIQQLLFKNGSVYVGATNTILQLRRNLSVLHQFNTGPGNDSSTCTGSLVCDTLSQVCNGPVTCNDNFNTLLLPYRDRLLACGTLYGACDLLNLSDVSVRFGEETDLKCLDNVESTSQKELKVSTRNYNTTLVGSIYVNNTNTDSDIFYWGKFHEDIKVLLAPSAVHSYFTVIENSESYVPKDRRPVYHFSWTNSDYGYVLWSTSSATPQLKLSRYCNRIVSELARAEVGPDTDLNRGSRSYTEITLQCNLHGTVLTDLISAAVYFNKLFLFYQNNNQVVICSSNVSNLNEQFNFVREQCWNSTDSRFVRPIIPSTRLQDCKKQDAFAKEWSTCGLPQQYSVFLTPVKATNPYLLTNDLTITIKATESATGFLIVQANELLSSFIGTSNGNILKVRLGKNTPVSEVISSRQSNPILSSMAIDYDGEQLLAATKNSVFQVALENCIQYTNCDDCLESQDIYCGWCILKNRCTVKHQCNLSNQTDYWIRPTTNSNQCPTISSLQPNNVSHNSGQTALTVSLTGTSLQTDLSYECEFFVAGMTDSFHSSSFQLDQGASSGSCQFDSASADGIPTRGDHNNVTLNIAYNGTAVVTTTLQVFSCPRVKELNPHTICTSCVSSKWGCSWCTNTASCSYNSSCNQPITEQSVCPRVTSISNRTSPIPVEKSNKFTLNTQNIFEPFSGYRCQYVFCEKTVYSEASIVDSTLTECTIPASELSCDNSNVSIQVFLERNDNYVIDTPSIASVQGIVFNCNVNIRSCGSCVAFRRRFNQCSWCPSTESCTASTSCSGKITSISSCSTGNIISVSPLNGPSQGGTIVTISGTNLGSVVTDISHVVLGTINCSVITNLYIPSQTVVCETNKASLKNASGSVTIHTTYGSPIQSRIDFQFKSVEASSFSPEVVINQSLITVNGKNLDVSTEALLTIGNETKNQVNCIDRSSSSFTCRIGQHPPGKTQFSVSIDKFKKNFKTLLNFVPTPTLRDFTPGPIRVFSGAGKTVNVSLSSVSGLQKVELQVDQRKTECLVLTSPPSVSCQVPPQQETSSRRKRRQTGNQADLILNDVHRINIGNIQYQPDPTLRDGVVLPCAAVISTANSSDFVSVQIPFNDLDRSVVTIQEVEVNLIPTLADLPSVVIPCNVVDIVDESVIFCRVNSSEWNKYKNEKINLNVTIGELVLSTSSSCNDFNVTIIIAVACAAAVIIILIILIIILVWLQRKKRLQQEEERKEILQKLDDLENKTRETARNAYYELQLGYMDNLEGNLTQRIIYLPPERYFTQTLFNLSRGHPILDKSALKNESSLRLEAIQDWTKLLQNREFLMIFIRTLEEQKRFTVQEKGNVASLLTVCLFSNMPYFTNIMFDLLTELIQKHVQKNPKLLLRRSESVVEKMVSHWLSITLYDECIMDKSGEPIFLLTKAVHFLVNSGPNDVIEDKSLNSLNESTLLSSEISFNMKALLASIQKEETEKATTPVEVSVVDVDTITQIKGKIIEAIYKDKPFSEYPNPDDFDLVLLSGEKSKEGIVLSDVDSTSEVEGVYKKLNTLKHYNIPEKTLVLLRPKGFSNPASPTVLSPLLNGRTSQMYHLIHPKDEESQSYRRVENGGGMRTNAVLQGLLNKPLQEIYLTRMVRSKTTIQGYVEKVFNSVLSPDPIPFAIRYFFQFLDREAARHRINDPEVVHIWKTNSLLLRYWVNVLKNPEFIFDINKTVIVDSCLNVITQAFMDACATTNRKLGHDSPSNKLLYAKESQQYKKMVKEFFIKVSNTPWMDDEEINKVLVKTSQQHAEKFNQDVASQQLFQYLVKYKDQILEAVRDNEHEDFAHGIEIVMAKMDNKAQSHTTLV